MCFNFTDLADCVDVYQSEVTFLWLVSPLSPSKDGIFCQNLQSCLSGQSNDCNSNTIASCIGFRW